MPKGWPKWAGFDADPDFQAYCQRHHAKLPGEKNIDWVQRHVPREATDTDRSWLEKVYAHPFWRHALVQWIPIDSQPNRAVLDPTEGTITFDLAAFDPLIEYYKFFGGWMDLRVKELKEMGWFQTQAQERQFRYGGFKIKNAVHDAMKFLGVKSTLCFDMGGSSFFHTNTIMPKQDVRQELMAAYRDETRPQDRLIYKPGLAGAWCMLVTDKHRQGLPIYPAITEHQLGPLRFKSSTTAEEADENQRLERTHKWHHYGLILYAQLVYARKQLILSGWISPERFVTMSASPDATFADLEDLGLPMRRKDANNQCYQLAAEILGQRYVEKQEKFKSTDKPERSEGEEVYAAQPSATACPPELHLRNYSPAKPKEYDEIVYYYATRKQLLPPLQLLNMLEGFDPSKIITKK